MLIRTHEGKGCREERKLHDTHFLQSVITPNPMPPNPCSRRKSKGKIKRHLFRLLTVRFSCSLLTSFSFLHHTTHAAHATHATHGSRALLDISLNNGDLGGTEEGGDTGGIDETSANDLKGVEDTGLDHVNVLALGGVEALVEVVGELVSELADNDGALETGVLNDGLGGAGDGVADNGNTKLLVKVGGLDVLEGVDGSLDEGSTTTGEDTLLNGSAGGVESIDEAVLLLTDLNLGGATDLDDGNTTRELGETLLELLLLVLGGGRIGHNAADLLAALGNGVLGAVTVEDDGVLLGDGDGAGRAEHVGGGLLELDVELLSEDGTVGQDGKIAEDGLAVVTEAGGLDGSNLELTAELVENADGKSLTVNVLGNDDEGAAGLAGDLEGGDDVGGLGDLLLGEEDQGLLELDLLGLGVGDEVGGDEAAVEAHTLGNLELIVESLALLAGDDTLLADLLHGGGNQLTNVLVAVGGDGGDLGNLLGGGDIALVGLEVLDDGLDGSLDTAAEIHGVAAGSNVLDGLGEDGAGEDGGGGGTVTGDLVGLAGNLLDEAGTEVLELVLQGDGLGDGDTICLGYGLAFVTRTTPWTEYTNPW